MSDTKAIGMSAAERDVRDMLRVYDDRGVVDMFDVVVKVGVLRTLMRDLDMWREITGNEIDKWSVNALVMMAKRILAEHYPITIFPQKKVMTLGDDGDLSRVFFITVHDGNDGPALISLLRDLIERIEQKPASDLTGPYRGDDGPGLGRDGMELYRRELGEKA